MYPENQEQILNYRKSRKNRTRIAKTIPVLFFLIAILSLHCLTNRQTDHKLLSDCLLQSAAIPVITQRKNQQLNFSL